jgi:hypothetical protein
VLDELEKTVVWDERFLAVIRQSPPQSVVDYKLLWRNPNPTWTSPGGLLLQLGDAAHQTQVQGTHRESRIQGPRNSNGAQTTQKSIPVNSATAIHIDRYHSRGLRF